MTYTIDNIEYIPKVGALDANGTVHFELDVTEDAIALYPTAYNASNGTIERISGSDPILVYNYRINLYTDKRGDVSVAVPQDEQTQLKRTSNPWLYTYVELCWTLHPITMPRYEYNCKDKKCETKVFEEIQSFSDKPKARCPECKKLTKDRKQFYGFSFTI